jgi:hypothetical protein
MGISGYEIQHWLRQLHQEIQNGAPTASSLMPFLHRFQALEQQLQELEIKKNKLK